MANVAIFSGTHCHGEAVARAVAEELGYGRIEETLIEEASRRFAISKDKLIRAMTGPPPFWNNFTREREKNVARLKAALADLLLEDDRLIHGYAAHLVPSAVSNILRVCVIANFPYRVEQAMRATGRPEKEAAKTVRKDDEQSLGWTRHLFEKAPYDEKLYDLTVPMQKSSVEEAAKLVCETARSSSLETTDIARLAARDFQLAARVNLALAEANHDVDVSARHEEVTVSLKHHVMRLKSYQEELTRVARGVSGVKGVQVELGPKYRAPGIGMSANIELPPKILLVDDEKEFVQSLSERLKKRNLESTVVYDGKEALELAKTDQPDVVVLDLMMPGIDGIEVLRRLKSAHSNIEVIILTGHGSEQEEKLAADLGAFAYLQKPVNIEVLAQVMRDAYKKVSEAKRSGQDKKD
ncbi:MAG: response regulator [Elusimicrobiota bacterium]